MTQTVYQHSILNAPIEQAKVLVIGDVMLDRYWQGTTERISPEAPVPVVKINDRSMRVGGAGNVAVNITSLGGQAFLIGMLGEDDAAKDLAHLLAKNQVENYCVTDAGISTTIKLRVLAQHQQLIRLDFEANVSHISQQKIDESFQQLLPRVNLVVLSDYGKGVVHDTVKFIQQAHKEQVKVLIDPKKNDFSEYAGAYLVTPNKKEFEAVAGACATQYDIESKARVLINQHQLGGLLVTQGEQGMTLIMRDEDAIHFPTHAREVFDVTGAGDTVIAALAAGISSGMKVADAVHLSCVAAGIVVGRIGTAKVTQDDILQDTVPGKMNMNKIVSEAELLDYVSQMREQGKKIAMTNGCFDILHSGHVHYLEQAAQMADIFIVAVNSDVSVKALKGDKRPINSLDNRLTVLAALGVIDRVVSFSEETPERLICAIKPDILIKGGDYKKEDIAGRQCAKDVQLIRFVDGQSTSNTIRKIQAI